MTGCNLQQTETDFEAPCPADMGEACHLETDRLLLAPFRDTNVTQQYVSWLNDPEVVRYSEQRHFRHTLANCRAYARRLRESPNWFLAVTRKREPVAHIGNLVVEFDRNNLTAEMSILIGDKSAWRKGLGTEVWAALMNELFANRCIRKVSAGAMLANEAMLAIMRRTGMKEEAVLKAHYLFEGKEMDVVRAAAFSPAGLSSQ